ncbi:MAG: DUF3810 domain-containing protein [bacterium]
MQLTRLTKLICSFLLGLGIILSLYSTHFSAQIESLYSTKIYYWTIRPYSLLTGLFPFSLAELLLVSLSIFFVSKIMKTVINLHSQQKSVLKQLPNLKHLVLILATVYLAFNLMWGFNYSRATFAEISGLDVKPTAVHELAELALHLTTRANELRQQVIENEHGVMTLPNGIRDLFNRAPLGYARAAQIYPQLGGRYGRPKGVLLSGYWSYTGISGAYFPFTAEANVNIHMPHFMLPSTTAHEMAHQRGFAREDEANYLAYLTCSMHPDPDFQYSGVMLALIHTMRSLARYDSDRWITIRSQYSDGVNRDLIDWSQYWDYYEGPVKEVSTRVNDTYLIANKQKDGVHSYGRMVDLMLAEFRQNNNKK